MKISMTSSLPSDIKSFNFNRKSHLVLIAPSWAVWNRFQKFNRRFPSWQTSTPTLNRKYKNWHSNLTMINCLKKNGKSVRFIVLSQLPSQSAKNLNKKTYSWIKVFTPLFSHLLRGWRGLLAGWQLLLPSNRGKLTNPNQLGGQEDPTPSFPLVGCKG